jgi:hypothetical protein
MRARPPGRLQHVQLGDGPKGTYTAEFGVSDRLVAPLLAAIGKA